MQTLAPDGFLRYNCYEITCREGGFSVLVRCETCRRHYDFDANDGLCPRCGAYNSLSEADARRLEVERRIRREELSRTSSSLCDAQDAKTGAAGRYAPDCMEDGHDPRHAHTGGIYLNDGEPLRPPVPKVPLSMSRTPVRDSYARKVNGLDPGSTKPDGKQPPKKNPLGIIIAIILALLSLLSNLE